MIVYKVTNTLTGKQYIGQTRYSLAHRWAAHCRKKSHCALLSAAIQKYGRDVFIKEVLFTSDCKDAINAKEMELIKELSTISPNGYNITAGGEAPRHSDETKKKLSENKKGSKNPMYGKPLSEEHKAKIKAALLGKKRPAEVIEKIKKNHNPKSDKNLTYRRNPNVQQ